MGDGFKEGAIMFQHQSHMGMNFVRITFIAHSKISAINSVKCVYKYKVYKCGILHSRLWIRLYLDLWKTLCNLVSHFGHLLFTIFEV